MSERPSSDTCDSTDESPMRVAVSPDMPPTERRRLLAAIGATGVTVLAGCLDTDDDPDGEDVDSYEVAFPDQDETVTVQADENILHPALDAGVDIPYTCEVGSCGECTARYDGDANEVVTHDGNEYLEDDQIEDGWVLTCVGFPEDDFELEVAHPDEE